MGRPRTAKGRAKVIFERLSGEYPGAVKELCELDHESPFQLLMATILSAQTTDARVNTVTPSQTLELMNFDLVVNWAQSLASRVLNDTGLTEEALINRAYRLTYGRSASPEEQKIAAGFFKTQTPILQARFDAGSKPAVPTSVPEALGMEPARKAAWVDFCQMLLNSNEFLYIN